MSPINWLPVGSPSNRELPTLPFLLLGTEAPGPCGLGALKAERVVNRFRDELMGRRPDERYFPTLVLTLPIPVQRSQPNFAEKPAVGPQKPLLMSVKSVAMAKLL